MKEEKLKATIMARKSFVRDVVFEGDVAAIKGVSRPSGREWVLKVEKKGLEELISRSRTIQEIFPQLSADQRELLMTGMDKEDWDVVFTSI